MMVFVGVIGVIGCMGGEVFVVVVDCDDFLVVFVVSCLFGDVVEGVVVEDVVDFVDLFVLYELDVVVDFIGLVFCIEYVLVCVVVGVVFVIGMIGLSEGGFDVFCEVVFEVLVLYVLNFLCGIVVFW